MIANVFFEPWIGINYLTNGYSGLKILLLGESHYCGDCEACISRSDKCKDKTKESIESFINYKSGSGIFENYMRTYTRFTNIFFFFFFNNIGLIDFWNSVAFYNYVQIAMDQPRQSPSMDDFEMSEKPFIEIVKKLNTDMIIVWGNRLWENITFNGYKGNNNFLDKQGRELYYYNINNKNIPAMGIYHPSSSYFNYNDSPYFKKMIDEIYDSKINKNE